MMLLALNIAIGAVLASVAALAIERLCRRNAVALRHAVLFAGLCIVATSPLLAIFARHAGVGALRSWQTNTVTLTPAKTAEKPSGLATSDSLVTPNHPQQNYQIFATNGSRNPWTSIPNPAYLALAVWVLGALLPLSRLIRGLALLHRLANLAEPAGVDVRRVVSACARRLRLRRVPAVRWCELAPSPWVMGVIRPRVLLPRSAASLSADELEAVLLHELAHIARGDPLVGLAAAITAAAFWWCVPVRMLIRRLGDLREQLCDSHVVRCQGHGLNLAMALLAVCESSIRARRYFTAAAALGAAGRSGSPLRARIRSLTEQEDTPMTQTTFATRLAVGVLGLTLAGGIAAVNVRAADSSAPAPTSPALSPTERMLSAPDFWTKGGATNQHDFEPATVAELEKLAKSADQPAIRLRAVKLLCDNAGHSRIGVKLDNAEVTRVMAGAFGYLESHLADATVAKYAPERGFTHMTVSLMADDKNAVWVLIETAALRPNFNGGLNIRFDLKTSKVTQVKQWGDIRPAAKP